MSTKKPPKDAACPGLDTGASGAWGARHGEARVNPRAIHIDCISAPNDGLNPSCILTVEGVPLTAQYVFQVPEGFSRFALEHKLRPGLGLRGVFVTGTAHQVHGLPGLVMRLRGDGHGAVELFGPQSVMAYVKAMPNVCSWKTPAIMVNEIVRVGSGEAMYEDEHVRVWPLWDDGGEEPEGEREQGDVRRFVSSSEMERADILEQLRCLAPQRGAGTHELFGRRYVRCGDVGHGDVWGREGAVQGDLPSRSPLLGYACYVKGAQHVVVVAGYADDVAARVEVLQRHWLVRGCVAARTSTVVVAGSNKGKQVPALDSNEVCRLIVVPTVGEHEENDGILGFDSTAKTSARLHAVCPHAFPAPHAWKFLRKNAEVFSSDRQPRSGAFRFTIAPNGCADAAMSYHPFVSSSRISSVAELQESCLKSMEFLDGMEAAEKQQLRLLLEKIRVSAVNDSRGSQSGAANNKSAAADLRQRLLEGKRKRNDNTLTIADASTEPESMDARSPSRGSHVCAAALTAPYILFLGTGSAEPSKYRGPSGILIRVPCMNDDYMLLECGEGTFGQLVRMFGYAGAMDRLGKLRFVWISHRHADHMSGLVELLCRRADCSMDSELLVLGPRACIRWLRSLEPVLNLGRFRVEHVSNVRHGGACRHLQQLIRADITCTPVHHCHDSFAISIVFSNRFKLVYSGDTEPCEALVRDGQNADVFIHEATFEPEMVRDARSKKHSTSREALEVAARAGARMTVLTHFSQRYPKFPKIDDESLEYSRVAVAFDGFAIPLDAKDEVAKVTRYLKMLVD